MAFTSAAQRRTRGTPQTTNHETETAPDPIKSAIRKAYDDRAEAYDRGNVRYTDLYLAPVIGQFIHEVKRAGRTEVLDLGCGPGHDALRMSRHGLHVTGIDLSEGMVKRARMKAIDARVMDYRELAFPEASFDGVWSARSLIHVPKAELPPILVSVARTLRPGGRFYLVAYEGEGEGLLADDLNFYTAQRYFAFYRRPELRALLTQAGLRVYREWSIRLRRPRHKEVLLAFASSISSQ